MASSAVLFIVFNRPDTTERVLKEIVKAKPSKLYVAGDGPRSDKEKVLTDRTRSLVEEMSQGLEREFLWRDSNLGCKRGVIGAINWFFENESEGIILEDDCLPDQSFFSYSKLALDKFRDQPGLMQIAGSNLMIKGGNPEDSGYFSRLPNIWGWATWKRAWDLYDPEMKNFESFVNGPKLKEIIKDPILLKRYISLFRKIKNGVDTWDFQWTYSCIMNDGLSLIPNSNLITNIGFGNNATHSIDPDNPLAGLPLERFNQGQIPENLNPDEEAERKFLEITNKIPPIHLRIKNKLKKIAHLILSSR